MIIVGIGYFFSYQYNSPEILYIAIIFSVVMNIAGFWFSDKIALSIAHAKPADEKEYLELHRIVENLAITAGLPKPKVYIIEDPAPNAFATGRNKEHAVVAVTSGLLSMMDRSELEGVIAHELSHIGNKDILLQSVIVVLVGFVSILAHMFTRSLLYRQSSNEDNQKGNIMAIVGIVFVILSPLFAQLIQLAISRKREYLADASGAILTRYPDGLASALAKIEKYAQPMRFASDATAHLFISNPFGRKVFGSIHRLFLTHPPTEDRIKALIGK